MLAWSQNEKKTTMFASNPGLKYNRNQALFTWNNLRCTEPKIYYPWTWCCLEWLNSFSTNSWLEVVVTPRSRRRIRHNVMKLRQIQSSNKRSLNKQQLAHLKYIQPLLHLKEITKNLCLILSLLSALLKETILWRYNDEKLEENWQKNSRVICIVFCRIWNNTNNETQ